MTLPTHDPGTCKLDWPWAVTTCDTPTIIAELYHNIHQGDLDGVIERVVCHLKTCICAHSTEKRIWSVNINIHHTGVNY